MDWASASGLMLTCLLIWFIPIPFPYRVLIIAFTLFLLVTPNVGVTQRGRTNRVRAWISGALLIVVAFRFGATFLDGSDLAVFLRSDVVSIVMAVLLGGGALRVLSLLPRGPTATAVVMAIGLVTAALPFASGEEPLWVAAGMALIGLAILIAALTIEELARVDASHSTIISVNNSLYCGAILARGSEEIRQLALPFGFEARTWRAVLNQVEALVDIVDSDATQDEIATTAGTTRDVLHNFV